MTATISRAELLRSTAEAFCRAFVTGTSPTEILDTYFTSNPSITEHGPSWASERLPFLGKTFQGRREDSVPDGSTSGGGTTCDDYYDLLTATLSSHPCEKTVPSSDQIVVDTQAKSPSGNPGVVTVKLQAEFKSIKTGKGWAEEFIYLLSDFDEDGKIGNQELWADPLSAWVAVGD